MSLFGGFALITSMLIMDLRPTKLKSLLATSVFVIAIVIYFVATADWELKDMPERPPLMQH
jgi:hypothetical protein